MESFGLVSRESISNGLLALRAINALLTAVIGQVRREVLFQVQAPGGRGTNALQELLWAVKQAELLCSRDWDNWDTEVGTAVQSGLGQLGYGSTNCCAVGIGTIGIRRYAGRSGKEVTSEVWGLY